jgi:hypothetical protein
VLGAGELAAAGGGDCFEQAPQATIDNVSATPLNTLARVIAAVLLSMCDLRAEDHTHMTTLSNYAA